MIKKPSIEEIARIEQELLKPITSQKIQDNSSQVVSAKFGKLDPRNYVQLDRLGIHGKKVLISKVSLDELLGLNWKESHLVLDDLGLYMPTPYIYLNYLSALVNAEYGTLQLFDGTGTAIKKGEVDSLYSHFFLGTQKSFGNLKNRRLCTWLNVIFTSKGWFKGSKMDYVSKILDHNLIFSTAESNVREKIDESGFVNFQEFDSLGLPIKHSEIQTYRAGKNIHYHPLIKGSIGQSYFRRAGDLLLGYHYTRNFRDSEASSLACLEISE